MSDFIGFTAITSSAFHWVPCVIKSSQFPSKELNWSLSERPSPGK